jgi:hypothetical protein
MNFLAYPFLLYLVDSTAELPCTVHCHPYGVCPIQPNLRFLISLLMFIWPVISHSFSLDITLGHQIFNDAHILHQWFGFVTGCSPEGDETRKVTASATADELQRVSQGFIPSTTPDMSEGRRWSLWTLASSCCHASKRVSMLLLLFRSRLCHYSVGGAWWHLGFYESV